MAVHGSFHWNEVATDDAAGSKAFYTGLLGWTTKAMPMPDGGEYTMWLAGGQPVGGMYQMKGGGAEFDRPQWVAYIAVDDVDATLAKVEGLGGAIHIPAMDVPDVGRFAIVKDPQGAVIALMKPAQGA
jgi:hypothetical protein